MHPITRGALRRTATGTTLGAAALFTLAAPASAGAPTRIDAEYWGVSCVAGLGHGQTLFLFGGGTTDGSEGGVGAFVEAADGSQVAEGQASAFSFGPGFTATVPLGESAFEVTATTTVGPARTTPVEERDGNRWTRGTETQSEVTMTATASYDGAQVELGPDACHGDIHAFDVRTTDPAAYVATSGDFGSDICEVTGLPDAQVRLTGALPDAYVEVVLDHGGDGAEKAQGELTVRGGRGTLQTDVVDLFTGESTTTVTIDVDLTRSGRTERIVESADGFTERRLVTPYLATIHVTLADGRHGTATCAAASVTDQVRVRPNR